MKKNISIKDEIMKITEGNGIDVVIDCVGAENTISDSFRAISRGGAIVVVGLFGRLKKIPVAPLVTNEYKKMGSFWGNYNELRSY